VIHLAASHTTTIVIIVSAVGAVAFVLTTMIVVLVFLAVFEGGEESTNDVQHFIELPDEARSLLHNGHALGGADASDVARFLAKKEEAREALWESRRKRAA
jgi:hypothetical protein